jgi:hypothetical protein
MDSRVMTKNDESGKRKMEERFIYLAVAFGFVLLIKIERVLWKISKDIKTQNELLERIRLNTK